MNKRKRLELPGEEGRYYHYLRYIPTNEAPMRQHVLLENAQRSQHRARPDLPVEAAYDTTTGQWRLQSSGDPVPFPPPTTKKHDIETGEDMKGE